MTGPLVSIITVCHNSIKTVSETIQSVHSQIYPNIEYIIIDGASTDGTLELINSFPKGIAKFISEPDSGMYEAINKGIRLATGDIVGILNSDDLFFDNDVIGRIAEAFVHWEIDAVYGDVQFVKDSDSTKVVRYYSSRNFHPGRFRYGFMPAHPTFYVRRELFEKFGYYREDYSIAADFELLLRFILLNKIRCKYLKGPMVSMRTGGISNRSVMSNLILNKEIIRASRENGMRTNYFNIYSKYFLKIFEFMPKLNQSVQNPDNWQR